MITALLWPGRAIAARLSFSGKLLLLAAIVAVRILFLLWSAHTTQAAAVEFSAKERDGLRVIDPAPQLLGAKQAYRSSALLALAAAAGIGPSLAGLAKRVDAAMAGNEKIDCELKSALETHSTFQAIQGAWQAQKNQGTKTFRAGQP
jgi:hypothetical protein